MLTKAKQIVIDKNIFQGVRLDALCQFARNHLLLVPDVLCYECHTDLAPSPARTLADCEKLIRCGAYYCACSIGFIQSEGRSLEPYTWFLGDLEVTRRVREGVSGWQEIDAKQLFEGRSAAAQRMLVDAIQNICRRAKPQLQGCMGEIRQLPADKADRFRVFLQKADTEMHDFAVESTRADWVRNRDRFCLSTEWMSWQYFRLLRACAMDYSCCRLLGSPVGESRAEHDYHDLEYVLLLGRADAILTGDKRLVEPLAKAAFPEKDVFSSLEEVPDSYRCDWANG
ncbi:MAG: hypothetical protein JW955_08520 [Sedimentisphaerales bacterium]|nr:hypothetical protein [Sedimentisphaerales bacterium]